tara:strand:- start:3955 stop:5859 length:1905 start_codon:yes stop_codon:yes gene_type:complete
MPKLTIGMAHFDDFHGVYFTLQALRLYNPEAIKDVELLVIDQSPHTGHGKMLSGFVEHWCNVNTGGSRYIQMSDPTGTSVSRDAVFKHASSDWVICMDCHVLLPPGTLPQIMDFIDGNTSKDLYTGSLLYDNLVDYSSHFDDQWRGEMWGTWGQAWQCCEGGIRFSAVQDRVDDKKAIFRDLSPGDAVPLKACHKCGKATPELNWFGHNQELVRAGYTRLADGTEPFEIPGQGLGFFMSRKDSWLGFNPHARGFGGEELYIHEKYRQNERKTWNLPWLKWGHRFGRPDGVPYPLTRWNKVRNYVLEYNELGLDTTPIREHFVDSGLMTEAAWQHLNKDPELNVTELTDDCPVCPGGATDDEKVGNAQNMEELYKALLGVPRDLEKHMPKLRELAGMCDHVTEISKRRESTVALAAAEPRTLASYQIEQASFFSKFDDWLSDTEWTRVVADSEAVEVIEETDMLFIDSTRHTFDRLTSELSKFAPAVGRFIVVHDTKLHAEKGEDGGPGLLAALRVFMIKNPEWSVIEHTDKQYGLTVLGKLEQDKPKLPSTFKMAANLVKTLSDHVVKGGDMCSTEELEVRLNVCSTCPQRKDDRCTVCGCFLSKKAALRTQPCPLGKWPMLGQIEKPAGEANQ